MFIPPVRSALSLFLLISCGPNSDPESSAGEPTARLGTGAAAERDRCDDRDDDDCRAPRVERVLLISIDGMHQVDLARFIAGNPHSHLAGLAATGIEYANAWVNRLDGTPTNPSDSFPDLLALTTGGSSPTTGGWYDVSYARDLYPDATCSAPGTAVAYDESAELDHSALFGAPGAAPTHDPRVVRTRFDPTHLPCRKTASGCSPVFPHEFLRVNTIFEVAHAAGLRTAWSDKHLAYELVTGPSGRGLDDFFAPEIAEDDAHVALLVSHPALRHETVDRLVRTKQVAPTILRALGLDPAELQAVRREGTPVLPRLPFASRDRWVLTRRARATPTQKRFAMNCQGKICLATLAALPACADVLDDSATQESVTVTTGCRSSTARCGGSVLAAGGVARPG